MVFRSIDERLWHSVRHNPLKFLDEVAQERLDAAAADTRVTALYDTMMAWFRHEQSGAPTWFSTTWPEHRTKPIAYFCAEFGLHNSVPIYSGGLGILAGDHLKAASDLGLPLKHKFMYYFDYGDSHQFEIEVVGIEPQAAPGDYPRVIESHGAAPQQYPYAEEDEWDDEDDLDEEET